LNVSSGALLLADAPADLLVLRCQEGDLRAFGALYDQYHRDVFRLVARLLGRDSEIADIVQAAFVEISKSIHRFDGRSSLRTWIFGLVAHLAYKHIRRAVRRRRAMRGLGDWPHGSPIRPDEALERAEALQILERSLDELDPKRRVTFVLCAVEGLPPEEAATALGVPIGTVYRRLSEARAHLRAALAEGAP
jgi:RNA polymerase sigma-70 factor (ECF subfamily)